MVGRRFHTVLAPLLALSMAAAAWAQFLPTQPATAPASRPTSQPASAGADWPMFRGCPTQTGVAGSPLPDELTVCWSYDLKAGSACTPAVVGGTVYISTDSGKLAALDLARGTVKWQFDGPEAIASSPTVIRAPAPGLVVFGDEAGTLRACDAATGVVRWSFEAGDRIVSSVNTAGAEPGRYQSADGCLVFGSYDGFVYALNSADGSLRWKYDVQERVHGTPAIADGFVLAAGCDGKLHVIRLDDGAAIRQVPLGSVSGSAVAVRGDRVFLGLYGEAVIGIDWQAGRVLWRFEDADRPFPFLSSAAITDDLVLIGGRDRRLRALDPATGRQRWALVMKGRVDSSPVVAGARVFVGAADGVLYAADLATGREVWRFEAGGGIAGSPAVGEGCLVIVTERGMVYCFGPRDCTASTPTER
ncbi:MAG: PQQ-binding-like beta-propeller repeat protein [Planctomycetota bacterium]